MSVQQAIIDTYQKRRLSHSESWRVALVGEYGVGKTTFAEEWAQGLDQGTKREEHRKLVFVDNIPSVVHLLDPRRCDTHPAKRTSLLQHPHAYLLMYSISNRDSFKMIPTLQKSIQRTAGHDPVFILVGNKADIDTDANTFGKPTLSSPLLPPPPPPSPTLGMETYRNITETRTGPTTEISESESDSTHMSLYGFGFTDYTNGDTKFNPEETTSVSTIVITSPSPTHSPWPTRGISTEEGQELARQLSCAAFFETSASTGECVENVIREAVRILREVAVAGRDGPHSRELRTKQERSWIGGLYDRVFGRKKSNGFRGEDGAEKCKVVVKEWNGCGWEVVEL